ncbi:hypothetical protein CDD82_2125 [Ophiocordyceps australis]|uniref:3-hydroxyacyl-CoA dehydrogenase NAD binding domain-containing protein n=1 Tax=Ophiocordyceps australis TaxID=1399860 RepID=A0A2C5ZKS8_9HYPO|nr:hypothetical protein CDD82_2125 [Ophiocordyceps australis]
MSPVTLPSTTDRHVVVLGGGVLGRRIACMWAAGGHNVVVRARSAKTRDAAVHYYETTFSEYPSKQRGTVRGVEDLAEAVKNSWLIIESIPEELQAKIDIFGQLAKVAPPDALLCSNSSSYKSREMVQGLDLSVRQRVSNMHYYMPPGNVIVELMTCGDTDASIFPFLVKKCKEIGLHPYVAHKECTGLIFNRMWAAIKREALNIYAEGVSTPEEIDALWVEMWSGSKSGPMAMMDNVGLDTVSFIEQHYIKERGLPTTPVDFLKKYIDEGRLGAKSDKGGLYPPKGAAVPADMRRQ